MLSNARSAPVVPAIASIVASEDDEDVDTDIRMGFRRRSVRGFERHALKLSG